MVNQSRRGRSQSQVAFLLALIGILLVIAPSLVWWWRDRSAPNVAAQAKDYLRERNVKPLDKGLDAILAQSQGSSSLTLDHPLLSQPAPDFLLNDHLRRLHELSEHLAQGPVVVVFYYGYYCNHCVSQLFALNDDSAKFHELGAEILAISADSSEQTAQKFAKYGAFDFPVLSDPDNKVAAKYSVFTPATETAKQTLLHGTFIVDRSGVVRWCHYSHAPFTDNATLLIELAKLTPDSSR